ncbi:hypothetical protein MTR_8g037070 [Medicago truncatula]|uniref:Uncharacterized protein n=1 Tax=Medicago truncatula TaxID=3880 RepID=G7LEH0_MEDTR|nr:hypothetical protein MTR_8g037070 [Medicago truncatula]
MSSVELKVRNIAKLKRQSEAAVCFNVNASDDSGVEELHDVVFFYQSKIRGMAISLGVRDINQA